MEQFFITNGDFIIKLVLAMSLGMVIGAERTLVHKEAGMKTHALVSMGAALFIIISEFLAQKYAGFSGFNPAIIASNIIVGIGFLGAGSIIFQDSSSRVMGLTTAAGLWITAGIGMASGFGFYSLAIVATVLVLMVFIVMNIIEKPLQKYSNNKSNKIEN
jgi:putative Mg2+ transporter-C (MgtC) family protein